LEIWFGLDLASHFGRAVRRQREKLAISQEELGYRAHLDRTYVSGVERGRRNPSLQVMQRLADALGSDLDVLFRSARKIALQKGHRPAL